MKKTATFCCCAAAALGLAATAVPAQAQAPAWTQISRFGGSSADAGAAVAVDATGNLFVTGTFGSPTLTLGTTTLTNAGGASGSTDIFVAKYSPAGAVVWATRLGSASGDDAVGLTLGDNGVTIAGTFAGTITVAGVALASAGSTDMLIVRLNANGVPQWGARAGGPLADNAAGVAYDSNGYVWLGGSFQGTATVTGTTTTLVSAGSYDQAAIKFVSLGGAYVRMGREGGTGSDLLHAIAADATNLYTAGSFAGATLPLMNGSTTLTTLTRRCPQRDGYLIHYDNFLTPQWAKSEGATGATTFEYYALALDAAGVVVAGGEFRGSIVVGGFDTIVNSGSSPTPMVVRYAAAGNVTSGRGNNSNNLASGRVTGLARDAAGNTYASGYFSGTTQWSGISVTSAGLSDVFVVKLPAAGNALWVVSGGGSDNEIGNGLALDAAGLCYVTGQYAGTPAFGGLPALTNAGSADAFVARLGGTVSATRAATAAMALGAWPNPVAAGQTLHLALPAALAGPVTLRLYDALGRLAYSQVVPVTAEATLSLPATLAPGRYLAEVSGDTHLLRCPLLVQ